MQEIILLKLGEVVLKGLNRGAFERRLLGNLRRRLRIAGDFDVYLTQSTIYVEPRGEMCDMDKAHEAALRVFGVAAVSRAAVCEKDPDIIAETAKTYLADKFSSARSFKVESKRADKRFIMQSIELSQYVGGKLAAAYPEVRVDVHDPELTVSLEVREKAAYVHAKAEAGAGGMPVGTNGTALALLSGGIDSPVAAWMMAKRGVELTMIHFFSYPYTSLRAREKVLELARLLSLWCGRLDVLIVPFTRIQEEIKKNCPEDYATLIMRRFMMRIADRVAQERNIRSVVTGESLGQVASQTMEAMAVTGACCTLPVFRPVIGMDKEEIVKIARRIGTFETSILPYEDCCTVFTPKHPRTKPRLKDTERAESTLDVGALVDEAIGGIETIKVD
ncbi:MAG: tRNA uracil 4-sulfurtransferase ThiI [Oscillospiraceae bacterium]|jgi:thiamine biosynthesis protein ThiI